LSEKPTRPAFPFPLSEGTIVIFRDSLKKLSPSEIYSLLTIISDLVKEYDKILGLIQDELSARGVPV